MERGAGKTEEGVRGDSWRAHIDMLIILSIYSII
jgi:hypothetical protein